MSNSDNHLQGNFPRTLPLIPTVWRKREFGLIPKPAQSGASDMERLEWRLCFKDFERDLIFGQMKPVIELLKAFRDKNPPLQNLHSYALKIMVLNLAYPSSVAFIPHPSSVAFKEQNR